MTSTLILFDFSVIGEGGVAGVDEGTELFGGAWTVPGSELENVRDSHAFDIC